jgi:hypothetical protein
MCTYIQKSVEVIGLKIFLIEYNQSEYCQWHKDFTDVLGTYTVNIGPYESSAQDRHLSLTTANHLTDDSRRLFFLVGVQY